MVMPRRAGRRWRWRSWRSPPRVLHARRCRRLARLAFGPERRPGSGRCSAPVLRVAAVAALAWGLVTLIELPPKVHVAEFIPDKERRHVLIVLDVSPSMRFKDAGPERQPEPDEARARRDGVVLRAVPVELYLLASWLATTAPSRSSSTPKISKSSETSSATPAASCLHLRQDRPLLGPGRGGQDRQPVAAQEYLLFMLSDGDTVAGTGMPSMPASIADV